MHDAPEPVPVVEDAAIDPRTGAASATIDGVRWSGITRAHRLWAALERAGAVPEVHAPAE